MDLKWLFDLYMLPQVHAPCGEDQAGHSVQDRILLLLGCTAHRCGTAAGSWRAFRLQSESHQAPSTAAEVLGATAPDQSQQRAVPPAAAQSPDTGTNNAASGAASSFSFGATSFGFDGPGESAEHGASSDPMSFADLDLALTTISSATGSTPAAAKATRQPSAGSTPATTAAADQHAGASGAVAGAVRLQRGPPLPGFHISWQDEPDAAPDGLRPADAAHVASLVDQYEADHEMVRCVIVEGCRPRMWSRTGPDCWPIVRRTTARSSHQMTLLAASRRNELCMHRQTLQARAGRARPTRPTRCRAVTAPSQSSASACSGRQSSAFATGQFRSPQFADLTCARNGL